MDCSNPFQKSLRFESLALKPPGRPAPEARKWFATIEIERMSCELDWLDKAIRIMEKQIQEMNQKRRARNNRGWPRSNDGGGAHTHKFLSATPEWARHRYSTDPDQTFWQHWTLLKFCQLNCPAKIIPVCIF